MCAVNKNGCLVELQELCKEWRDGRMEVECYGKLEGVRQRVKELCNSLMKGVSVKDAGVLVEVLEGYEVTRDEGVLQQVLNMVCRGMDELSISGDSVRLLAYCYYYVEEEECISKAREMLLALKQRGEDAEEIRLAEQVLLEMAG